MPTLNFEAAASGGAAFWHPMRRCATMVHGSPPKEMHITEIRYYAHDTCRPILAKAASELRPLTTERQRA